MKRIVVCFSSGREASGHIIMFNMNKPSFPLQYKTADGKIDVESILFADVKKILFLKEDGSPTTIHHETIDQTAFAGPVAFRVTVEFHDGEILTGSTLKIDRSEKGFFLIPLNPGDRCERIYINFDCIEKLIQRKLLGRIILDENKITPGQLDNATRLLAEQKGKKIGTIMVEENMISQAQLDETLRIQKERTLKLGELLVESGYVTKTQVEEALRIQQAYRKKKLGQILVELKYVTPNDICLALASQLGCPWVDLSSAVLSPELVSLLPVEVMENYEVVPVEKKAHNILVVATTQPQDPALKKELEKLRPWMFEIVIAFDGYIMSLLHQCLPDKSNGSIPKNADD